MIQFKELNGITLYNMFMNGYRNLKLHTDYINDLNVFPVPDGDTGTNMSKTLGGGLKSVDGETEHVAAFMRAFSDAVLFSARGNSGVILSQFVHGIYEGLKDKETISLADFAYAFECARKDAYASVITPTQGTILTVISEGADFLQENYSHFADFRECLKHLTANMHETLDRTPDLLPILKEAGVVDSGGAGLVCIVEGMYAYLCDKIIDNTELHEDYDTPSAPVFSNFGPDSTLEYGYCTEFILQLTNAKTDIANFDLKPFIAFLEECGDSIVAVKNDSIVKVHVHTFEPERVMAYARSFGEFLTIKIENMSVQHSENVSKEEEKPTPKIHMKYAIVSVASGEGIIEYFKSIGATSVINGGQTQNPSVDDFLHAFEQLDAEYIVVLPNNSNVILSAKQAAALYTASDVRVIPTNSVMEGYSALSMMDLWASDIDSLLGDMTSAIKGVNTCSLTTATRDTQINGISVEKGDYIGLESGAIITAGKDRLQTVLDLIHKSKDIDDKQVITVFYGNNVTEEETEELMELVTSAYPLIEIGFISGGQDVYSYIMAIE